tara:strand:- start:721 stop:915 length:195 start_codon:yes stop_codon:yes gene_type:complete
MGNSTRCKVCKAMRDTHEGCITKHGFVCRACVGHWLEDYIKMVNPFVHLNNKEIFKLRDDYNGK